MLVEVSAQELAGLCLCLEVVSLARSPVKDQCLETLLQSASLTWRHSTSREAELKLLEPFAGMHFYWFICIVWIKMGINLIVVQFYFLSCSLLLSNLFFKVVDDCL